MNDEQLLRYSRQIMLSDLDIQGQEKLLAARILIVGMGGLGSPAAFYLAAAGVGHLVLADFDAVDMTNLQRQIIHNTQRIGVNKAQSAAHSLRELNPGITLTVVEKAMDEAELGKQIYLADLVLDCSDNFATRFAINRACVAAKKPLVSGAAIRLEGQISVFDARQPQSPCYRCLYDESSEDLTCVANGVLGPLVGVIGSLQALEAIKLIVGFGTGLMGRLLVLDARHLQCREIKLSKDQHCPVCNHS